MTSPGSRRPSTNEGRLLEAALLGDEDGISLVARAIAPEEPATAIIGIAFGLLARRRFGAIKDAREITRYINHTTSAVADRSPSAARRAEVLTRFSLGEMSLFRPADPELDVAIMQDLSTSFVADLEFSQDDIRVLVEEAESIIASEPSARVKGPKPFGPFHNASRSTKSPTSNARNKGNSRSLLRRRRKIGHPGRTREPITMLGQMMRTRALREPELADYWLGRLVDTNWVNVDEFTEILFAVAVGRCFRADSMVGEIAAFVTGMGVAYGNDKLDIVPIETEMLIRKQLGEEVPVTDIGWKQAMLLKHVVFVGVVDHLRYSEKEIDELLLEVERIAFEQRLRPTLAMPVSPD